MVHHMPTPPSPFTDPRHVKHYPLPLRTPTIVHQVGRTVEGGIEEEVFPSRNYRNPRQKSTSSLKSGMVKEEEEED